MLVAGKLIALGVVWASVGQAGGYQLRQHDAAGLGAALAGGGAGAHGLGGAFWNPAVVGLAGRPTARASATYIAPVSEVDDAAGSTVLGSSTGGRAALDDVTPDVVVPALYAAAPVGERLHVGLAVNAPFGLQTDYADDWAGRYHARATEVATLSVNPVLALRVSDALTVAGGVVAQYYDARLTSAVDFGTIGTLQGIGVAVPAGNDGAVEMEADDWGFGFNLGLMLRPLAGTRIGVGYRSEIRHDLSGKADFTADDAGVATALRAASGAFTDTGARADITTPQILSLSVAQDLTRRLTLLAEAQWTGWSSFDVLRVRFDNPAQPDDVTDESWRDSWFGALGLRYRPDPAWTLRLGVAYDESPVPDHTRTPRIPDADRVWLSAGVGYAPAPWLRLDLGYTHMFMRAEPIRLDAGGPGNTFRGALDARSDTSVDILALGATLRF